MKPLFMKKKDQMQEKDRQGQVEVQGEAGCDVDGEENADLTDRMRVSCDISRGHHRKLKVFAAKNGITLNETIEKLADCHCGN